MRGLWDAGSAKVNEWYVKQLSGCLSSNGKPYCVSLKKGRINKLLVFFVGGGLSWSDETAAKPITILKTLTNQETYYVSDVSTMLLKLLHFDKGILNAKDKRNPFHDWHVLNIPYATGDLHIGNAEYTYENVKGRPATLYHHGEKNVEAALNLLPELISETPETLVIAGISAGAYGCVAHSPRIRKVFPYCNDIVVYAENSHIHSASWKKIVRNVWNVKADIAEYIRSENLIVDLFRYANDYMPGGTVFLNSNSLWDRDLLKIMNKMNHDRYVIEPPALKEYYDTLLEAVGILKKDIPNYYYFLTDYGKSPKNQTTPHVFCGSPKLFYGDIQDGMSIANWIRQALEKKPLIIGGGFLTV